MSVYRNVSDDGHRVRIRLVGGSSNRFGVGAKIDLTSGDQRQTRYVNLGAGVAIIE